jgi:dihydrofolate synthase/folylpolyglutamate synthase
MTSALAFQYFMEQDADVAVVETGLGGRLDSTNIITPELSVITNIGYDHMDLLGDTLEKIAREKAGIVKPGTPVVVGETNPETENVFRVAAAANNSLICFADQIYHVEKHEVMDSGSREIFLRSKDGAAEAVYEIDLLGEYQLKNIVTVCTAIDRLNELGFDLSQVVKGGLKSAAKDTGLMGRWQVLSENPLTICDTGHNQEGLSVLVKQIRNLHFEKLHFVFGVVSDKDVAHILTLLPSEGRYYFTRADIPRAMDENELKQKAENAGLHGEAYHSVKIAVMAAKKNAASNDLIFIGGSTFVVADALKSELFF